MAVPLRVASLSGWIVLAALATPASADEARPEVSVSAESAAKAGRHREAAELLAAAIAALPPGPSEERARLQALLKEQKAHVATVLVKLPREVAATIVVDGVEVGAYPLALPLYLEPGKHTFGALADEARFGRIEAELAAGRAVTITLEEAPRAKMVAPPPKPVWPAIVLGSLGTGALAVGIGTLIVSFARESAAEDRALAIGACNPEAPSGPCDELSALVADRNALRNASTVAFVAAGVLGAATVGYLAIPLPVEDAPPPAGAAARLHIGPVPTLGGAMVALGGTLP